MTRTSCDSGSLGRQQVAGQPLSNLLLHHHLLWMASGLPVLYDHTLFNKAHDLQPQPMPTPLAPLSQVQTAAQMFPSRIPSAVTAILSLTPPDSVTCPPPIRPIFLMQAIRKAQSSPMSLKSAARRVWFVRTARKSTLAIVSGTIAATSLNSNRRGMPE